MSIMYDGSNYNGFQTQGDKSTIQEYLEKSLTTFFATNTRIKGASRTDSGVHAYNQTATFTTHKEIQKARWLSGLNALLPKNITITNIQKVDNTFHPIKNAKAKIYRYTLWLGRCYNPFICQYVWSIPANINLSLIEDSLKLFVGTLDFSSFCNSNTDVATKTRTIYEIKTIRRDSCIDIWFYGEGFLKQMIRIIVGTLVNVGLKKIQQKDITNIFLRKDRKYAGPTAPAKGLTLVDIFYSDVPKNIDVIISNIKKDYFFVL